MVLTTKAQSLGGQNPGFLGVAATSWLIFGKTLNKNSRRYENAGSFILMINGKR
jgi:hypothetical protein